MIRAEGDVMEIVAAVKESVAVSPTLALVLRMGRLMDSEISALDEAMERIWAAMVGVLESTEALHGSTMRKVMKVLRLTQAVKFLVVAAQFQLIGNKRFLRLEMLERLRRN
ncbi:hypothetical protein PanWU01x14_096200 [Parasponia andersonii]|uniref:DOG1 domain-containing protein n=1 Tax=Parasponia andersonii TaxID=3476 RepID=A0A2P5D4S8_PARAD|nr:hypothetical protein PanWU01x14_096200 [Parasponia andersonii]